MIRFHCSKCGKGVKAPDKYAGKTVKCPNCQETNKSVKIDISALESKDVDFDKYPKGQNEFELMLPVTKKLIRFKLLTHADEKLISEELKALKKKKIIDAAEVTTRLKHAIVEIDGKRDVGTIRLFVDSMPSRDSFELRTTIAKISPDINSEFNFECEYCEHEDVMSVPMELEFFWPSGRL